MKTTRRFFLGGMAAASLPVATVAAAPVIEAPTREELEHYYAFLWCEFKALSDEMGVDMHDNYTLHKSGGWEAYQAAFGASAPSTRAKETVRASA
ncbi:hypothetical protein [Agrobacterium rubi]|uniref:Tat pathway signal protein n=1 Tax=Agrobacterium rubi TaxID=28099 RepID=A0ABX2IXP5_9HYPH|nr:hypothetical protein [Agrobacterium rubi]NTF35527.1 hypothetical protein [Agrobacterium rubi]